ncbi:MAG: cupin domain-containing protein [Defluviicoccus sp.]|nr:MAG: cupin domain-containing protein [Defluviicoccus sp.]
MRDLFRKRKFPTPLERVRVAAEWRDRGYSCALFVDPPGRAWDDFVHKSNELVAVAEGRLEVTINGTRMVAEPGDEVFIPRGTLHSVRNIHSDTTRWLYGFD